MLTRVRMFSKALLSALGLMALAAGPLAAQVTLFQPQPRDTAEADLSRYPNLYMCRAAVDRVALYAPMLKVLETGIDPDTVHVIRPSLKRPGLPEVARETARKCLQGTAMPDSIDAVNVGLVVPLLFEAGLNDRAMEVVEQRLATDGLEGDSAVLAAMDTIDNIYRSLNVQSRRPMELVEFVAQKLIPRIEDPVKRADAYMGMAWAYLPVDSATTFTYAMRMIQEIASLDEEELDRARREGEFKGLYRVDVDKIADHLFAAYHQINRNVQALDSLRESTAAHVRHVRRVWSLAQNQPEEAAPPIGERAPEIEAELWLGCDSPCGPRPTPGRVSLMMYRHGGNPIDENKWVVFLRRLEKRFPALETTILSDSHGYFVLQQVAPEKEAELVHESLDSLGIRAALAMAETPHWYLPDPDERRINRETANEINYTFGGRWQAFNSNTPPLYAILVDQDGIVVAIEKMNQDNEEYFARMIEILLEREAPST